MNGAVLRGGEQWFGSQFESEILHNFESMFDNSEYMRQETIEKCYSFLEEMQVAALHNAPFNYDGAAKSLRCTPMYYKYAIEAGLFKKEDKVLICLVDAVTREHAERVVKLTNQYFSKKQVDTFPEKQVPAPVKEEAHPDTSVQVERNKPSEQVQVKEEKKKPDMQDAKCLELFTVEQLIGELKRRGFSGEIKISHTF